MKQLNQQGRFEPNFTPLIHSLIHFMNNKQTQRKDELPHIAGIDKPGGAAPLNNLIFGCAEMDKKNH